MTNSIVVGVGNIYASESLFLAGIHPARPANRISHLDTPLGYSSKGPICAIEAGGTTLRDFVNGQGEPGYFQQTLLYMVAPETHVSDVVTRLVIDDCWQKQLLLPPMSNLVVKVIS